MTAITIHLPEGDADKLRELAHTLGTSPEALAADAVRERIAREASGFEAVAARVVAKNAELYRRLA